MWVGGFRGGPGPPGPKGPRREIPQPAQFILYHIRFCIVFHSIFYSIFYIYYIFYYIYFYICYIFNYIFIAIIYFETAFSSALSRPAGPFLKKNVFFFTFQKVYFAEKLTFPTNSLFYNIAPIGLGPIYVLEDVESFTNQGSTVKSVHCASSYGRFNGAKEFWSQRCIWLCLKDLFEENTEFL